MTAERINRLLITYNFEFEGGVPDNLKCDLCKNILVNACQSRCGCRFCSKCIMEYVSKGNLYCPGGTSECKEENLTICSNIHTDYRVNRKISKMKVKCPEETCKVYCELIEVEEHLRLCTMKSMDCPFFSVGCSQPKMVMQDLNGHLQSGAYQHSKLLIDIISNMRNDFFGLSLKEVELREELHKVNEHLKSQKENIASINSEIKVIKDDKKEYKEQFEKFKGEIEDKIKELRKELRLSETRIKQECLDIVTVEGAKLRKDFQIFQEKTDIKIQEIESYLKRKINETSGIFSWNIIGISVKRKENQSIFSEYFYSKVNKHKISLQFAANGSNDVIGVGCSIFLFIYSGIQESKLIWPFQANVTIKIVNISVPDSCKTMTKFFRIEQPPCNYNWSDPFYFYYNELAVVGLIFNDSFTIECFVDEI